MTELRRGNSDAAWDLFIARYRRVIFAAIHRYARDPDDAMDVFASVCEALRRDELGRLRRYADRLEHSARVSTWLVTVVRHLTIDWFRHRDGRRRLSVIAGVVPDEAPVQLPRSGETGERQARLADAMSQLDTSERRAIDLYVFDERPASTVARALGLRNAKAVYNRVYRALGILKERLEKAGIRRGDL